MGSYMITDYGFFETDITTFFINSHFKYQGLSIMGEYVDRSSSDMFAKNSDGSLNGDVVNIGSATNLQIGYLFSSDIALTARYTGISFDKAVTNNNNINQYTIGVSRYFVRHKLKIQTDMSYENSLYSNDKIFYRLQFEIHF